MEKCPNCGEEVQDVDVIFHRCTNITANEEYKTDPLFVWLKFVTIATAIIYFAELVLTPFGMLGLFLTYTGTPLRFFIIQFILIRFIQLILGGPLIYSWLSWNKKRRMKTLIWSLVALLSLVTFIYFYLTWELY